MDKSLIEKYKTEMLNMYKQKNGTAVTTVAQITPTPQTPDLADGTGGLIAIITTLRELYPVENARVTVFKGMGQDRQIIASRLTNSSGKTEPFILETPSKAPTLDKNSDEPAYTLYNMLVEKDGYRDNLHINIPIFSNTVSLQHSDLMLLETAGVDKSAQIFDEAPVYNL